MIKNIYSIWDRKSLTFSAPFYAINDGTAMRSVGHAVSDPKSELSYACADYELHVLGTFDDSNGVLTQAAPEFLINVQQLKEQI